MNTTVGIEIELPWPTMLRRIDEEAAQILEESYGFYTLTGASKQRVQQGFDALDTAYKDTVESVFGERIARGNDGFAEFALRPQYEHAALTDTVAELYDADILVQGEEYPLHVTLGNVSASSAAWVILMALELSGGVTSERIIESTTWSRKGRAGILSRRPEELQLDASQGFEMRTLLLRDIESLRDLLMIAQVAGESMANRDTARKTSLVFDFFDLKNLLERRAGEKMIDVSYRWNNPQNTLKPWKRLAAAIADESWQKAVKSEILDVVTA